MKKKFQYKGQEFLIRVWINKRMERRINGKVSHAVTIRQTNVVNGIIPREVECETHELKDTVIALEKYAKEYVDTPEIQNHEEVTLLNNMGFIEDKEDFTPLD